MDFVLELSPAAGGGLGELRYGMTGDEAVAALDSWRQQPGPPGVACRDSGLSIAPAFGGSRQAHESVVVGISFGGPPDGTDRVLFDGVDLWDGTLLTIVAELRQRGHAVARHGPERYAIDNTEVWLMLERPPQFDPSWPHKIDLSVAPNLVRTLSPA